MINMFPICITIIQIDHSCIFGHHLRNHLRDGNVSEPMVSINIYLPFIEIVLPQHHIVGPYGSMATL